MAVAEADLGLVAIDGEDLHDTLLAARESLAPAEQLGADCGQVDRDGSGLHILAAATADDQPGFGRRLVGRVVAAGQFPEGGSLGSIEALAEQRLVDHAPPRPAVACEPGTEEMWIGAGLGEGKARTGHLDGSSFARR